MHYSLISPKETSKGHAIRAVHIQDSLPDSTLPITSKILTKTSNLHTDTDADANARVTTTALPVISFSRA